MKVFEALCRHHSIPEVFEILDGKGIDQLFDHLPVRLKGSEVGRVGIVIDADPDVGLEARWNKAELPLWLEPKGR